MQGRSLGAVERDIERQLRDTSFPLEYHAELLGENGARQDTDNRGLAFGVAAAIGIFLLLQAAFGSWRLAAIYFFTLPTALVGGVLAAFAAGGDVSIGSYAGFLALLGIAARNGIVLISHYQHLEQHEGETFGPALVLRGTQERLAPILMTAIATGLALVPLMVFDGIFGYEIVNPMAIVILGGLVTSTVLNLFIVPALYLLFATSTGTDTLSGGQVQVEPTGGGS